MNPITVGIQRETKIGESRVVLTPWDVKKLTNYIDVYVETGAGVISGFYDDDYVSAGCSIVDSPKTLYDKADVIIKVKELQPNEYDLINEKHTLISFLHLASNYDLTKLLLERNVTSFAFETYEKDGTLPILEPMSVIAGHIAIQRGSAFCPKLLGGAPGVSNAKVLIFGGGVVGAAAAKSARDLGADVTVCDININRLREYHNNGYKTMISSGTSKAGNIREFDIIVGAVHKKGTRTPIVAETNDRTSIKAGTLVIDVSIDQGGCFSSSHQTTHNDPVYFENDVNHYCVANLPGIVPWTSSRALSAAAINPIMEIIHHENVDQQKLLKLGVNTHRSPTDAGRLHISSLPFIGLYSRYGF